MQVIMQIIIGVIQYSIIHILSIKVIEYKDSNKLSKYLVENSKRFENRQFMLFIATILISNIVAGFIGELVMIVGMLNYELVTNNRYKRI